MSLNSILELARIAMGNERLQAEISSARISRANTPLFAQQIDKTGEALNPKLSIVQPFENQPTISAPGNISNKKYGEIGIRQVYDPSNPIANSAGFVSYPEVDLASEFVSLTLAKRAYEANVRIFNTASGMHRKALELGK